MAACPEFHVGYRSGQELFTLPTYILFYTLSALFFYLNTLIYSHLSQFSLQPEDEEELDDEKSEDSEVDAEKDDDDDDSDDDDNAHEEL